MNWYRKAADQGYADAQHNLGVMYLNGDGVPKDSAEAVKWFRKAAEQGLADSQYNLGGLYANGNGVPRDEIEGLAWFNIAAASGYEISIQNRNSMEIRLGRDATLAAQQRSREILEGIGTAIPAQNALQRSRVTTFRPLPDDEG